MAVDDATRIALYRKWGKKCGWCRTPFLYSEMEVDHFIPQSFEGVELSSALAMHGLPDGYDVHTAKNLIPACRRCNGTKGDRAAPDTPIVSILLERAANYAPDVERQAAAYVKKQKYELLSAQLTAIIEDNDIDPGTAERLADLLQDVQSQIDVDAPKVVANDIHPALQFVFNPGRWTTVSSTPPGGAVAYVHDGRVGGYTGTSPRGFACPNCGSHGPWSGGTRCLTCGSVSDPND